METIEGNKLIVFFDGAMNTEIDILGKMEPVIKYKDKYYPEWNLPKFNEDWNLIIPIIKTAKEKIRKAGWGTPTTKEAWKYLEPVLNEVYNLNIQNAHYCLVKFIEWYTKQIENGIK